MKNLTRIISVLLLMGVMIVGCTSSTRVIPKTDSTRGIPTTDAIRPPGVLLNEANIRKFTPAGINRDALIKMYRQMNASKRGTYLNGRAIAISTRQPARIYWRTNSSSNPGARVAVLNDCNKKHSDCILYCVGNVIVYPSPYE